MHYFVRAIPAQMVEYGHNVIPQTGRPNCADLSDLVVELPCTLTVIQFPDTTQLVIRCHQLVMHGAYRDSDAAACQRPPVSATSTCRELGAWHRHERYLLLAQAVAACGGRSEPAAKAYETQRAAAT